MIEIAAAVISALEPKPRRRH